MCKSESLKYKSVIEFKKKNSACLQAIYLNKWNDIIDFIKSLELTKEECIEFSKKTNSLQEFHCKYPKAFNLCKKNNWIEEATSHMEQYWKFDVCKKISSMFDFRTDFFKNHRRAYDIARKNGWLEIFYKNE